MALNIQLPTGGSAVPGTKVKIGGQGKGPDVFPTDAMPSGVHMDIRKASMHKKKVSAVLHLKKQSLGHRHNPSAFNRGNKAFNAFTRGKNS